MGLIAIFIALTGTAWAAGTVGPRDLKRDAVRAKHVKDGQIGSAEIAADSLGGADIDESALSQVPSAQTATSAQTAQTATSAQSAQTATSAGAADTAASSENANLLDGKDSSEFLGISGKAADSSRVNGQAGFHDYMFAQAGSTVTTAIYGGSFPFRFTYTCPADPLTTDGTLTLVNLDENTVSFWRDTGGTTAPLVQLAPNGTDALTMTRTGDRVAYFPANRGRLWITTVHRDLASDRCDAYFQGLLD